MTGRHPAGGAALALALTLAFGAAPALAAVQDRKPPTAPTNLRVTGRTSYTVALAWNASTDNTGVVSYVIQISNGMSVAVGGSATSHTVNTGLLAGTGYSFNVHAADAAGNRSKNSNTVSVTLPADGTPPTASTLSVTDAGPTHVSLTWTPSIDDGPTVRYWVFRDGSPVLQGISATSATVPLLEPETAYTFTVQARDNWQNWSPPSNAVTVTTPPADTSDTTPPTTPANLSGMNFRDEVWLSWTQSTDDRTPQPVIEYEIYVNGRLDHRLTGDDQTVVYANLDGPNTFDVIAVDAAGNRSAPATITLDIDNGT